MKSATSKRDAMLKDSPLKSIFFFGLPIMLGSVFQQFYSMVDSIVVGNYVGASALAAVGASAHICGLLVMVCCGFNMGASIVIAQQYGAGRHDEIKRSISTTLIFALIFSVVVTLIAIPIIPAIARLTKIPDDIIDDAILYMRLFCGGLIFLMMYNFFAAILRALGDSVTPLIFLIVSSLLNIAGDLLLVLVFHMGVAGVAIATVLAQLISVICCAIYVRKKSHYFTWEKGEFVFDKTLFAVILRMAIPSTIQMSVSQIGFVFVQSLVNTFSTTNIAAYTAAGKMEMFSMLPIMGFTQAFGVFVGQNLGAGRMDRAKQGLKVMLIFNVVVGLACGALIYVIGPQLIGLFVKSSEVVVIERGTAYMRAFCPFLVLHALMSVLMNLLKGSGDSVFCMSISLTDLGVRVAFAYLLSLGFGIGFMGCAYSIPIGWLAATLVGLVRFLSGKWKTKVVVHGATEAEE